MTTAEASPRGVLASYLVPLAVAAAAAAVMQARFMGDTVDYVASSFTFDSRSWDFGHLCWVPLGWMARSTLDLDRTGVVVTFLAVNAVSGVLAVGLLRAALGLVGVRPWPAAAVSLAFLFAQAMLNFTLSGSSYVPGLALTLLALTLALLRPASPAGAWLAAVGTAAALAGAICCWFPYVLAVPGVLLAPAVLRGPDRRHLLFALRAGSSLGLLLLATFGAAAWAVGVRDPAGFRAWVAESSHGVQTGGLARMVFGLARSFLFMGDDGLVLKRYLLHDPYNPVSRRDLAGLSLWKLALFYVMLASVALLLLRDPRGRRLALLAAVGGVPVVVFGLFWQGGDMERYLPLYPFFFLALAGAWESPGGLPGLRGLVAGFFIVAVIVNAGAHSRWEVKRYQDTLADRVRDLTPRLKPGGTLVVVRDRLKLLPRDFPLDPAGRGLRVHETATPGLATTAGWHADFAAAALKAWSDGGDVWLSRRLFEPRPRADGTWVEGEDPRLKWADVSAFFSTWEHDEEAGGGDGFVRLRNTPAQRRRLEGLARGR